MNTEQIKNEIQENQGSLPSQEEFNSEPELEKAPILVDADPGNQTIVAGTADGDKLLNESIPAPKIWLTFETEQDKANFVADTDFQDGVSARLFFERIAKAIKDELRKELEPKPDVEQIPAPKSWDEVKKEIISETDLEEILKIKAKIEPDQRVRGLYEQTRAALKELRS